MLSETQARFKMPKLPEDYQAYIPKNESWFLTSKHKTTAELMNDQLSDLGDTLDLMDKMERAKRRGCISITREVIRCGLADKLLPLLNVVYKEYSIRLNQIDVYFEHESLDVVPEGCVCPFYIVNIDDTNGIRFDI